jgi:hypothetical protein
MATPNAAGVAALIWSAHPSWTRDQVAAQFIGTADSIDTINPAYAGLLGSGRVNSFRGVLETLDPPRIEGVPGLPAEGGTAITPITSFGVDLANVLDPTTVVVSSFELRGDGVDDAFDTPDDVILPLALPTGFTYRVGSNRLTLSTSGMGTDRYRFRALSGGLKDPFGSALDGNADGVAGDHFERTFSFIVPATISGQKFFDVNRNAMKDAGEPGLPGWNIDLDLNNNGVLEGGAVEPDSFAAGTVLNTIIPQATLHAIGSTGADLAPNTVLSSTGAFASTGTRVFGSSVGGTIWTDDDFRLRIDFTAPVSSVSIDAISDDTLDVGRLEIYNSSNVLLATVITSELVGAGQFATMTANRLWRTSRTRSPAATTVSSSCSIICTSAASPAGSPTLRATTPSSTSNQGLTSSAKSRKRAGSRWRRRGGSTPLPSHPASWRTVSISVTDRCK